MADGKWIDELSGDMPLTAAARLVLTVRLGVVRDRLPLAAERADEDVEHVHQLRVATRRAGAALRIFAAVLPERLHRKARRTLRRLRRAAGAARDWDVFLDTVGQRRRRADAKQRRGFDVLAGYAHGRRVAAQQGLTEAAAAKGPALPGLLADLGRALRDEPAGGLTLRDLAVPTLTELVRELEQAAGTDLAKYEQLHQVRILGKQLRYAMEVFATCFGPPFREEYYPAVAAMQEILGLANDSHVAVQRLEELKLRLLRTQPETWPGYQPGVEALLRFHRQRLPRQRHAFEKWWRDWQGSGAEGAFAGLIREAGSPA